MRNKSKAVELEISLIIWQRRGDLEGKMSTGVVVLWQSRDPKKSLIISQKIRVEILLVKGY